MFYWIWFCSLSLAAFSIAYFTAKRNVGHPSPGLPILLQIFSLSMTWKIHGGKLWAFLSDNIPEPDTIIHSFTVVSITTFPVVLWVLFPVIFWEIVLDYLSNSKRV